MWNDSTSGSLRLRFDVLPSESSASPEIVNATLMLHLKERDCECLSCVIIFFLSVMRCASFYFDPLTAFLSVRNTERILIKVLQYLKPLRRRNRSRGQPNRRNSKCNYVQVQLVYNLLISAAIPFISAGWNIRGMRNISPRGLNNANDAISIYDFICVSYRIFF